MAAVEELSAKRQKTEEEPENEAEKEVSAKRQKTKDEPENDTEKDVSNGQEEVCPLTIIYNNVDNY